MGAIFGWSGAPDTPQLEKMHRRLRHRGVEIRSLERGGKVLLAAAASTAPDRAIAADRRFALIADGRLCDPSISVAGEGLSTAEQLLEVWRREGGTAVTAANGDFAFALWDTLTHTLLLGRDYAGVKPLFYTRLADGRIAFASEYKALMALPGFDATIDRDALQRVQGSKYVPMTGRGTLFRAVFSVPPGTLIAIDRRGGVSVVARAPLLPLEVRDEPLEALQQRIAATFTRSTARRLRSAGRVGVALSGGVDSIGVAFACRSQLGEAPLRFFTAGSGPNDPEVRTAAVVAARLEAPHHVVEVPPERIAEVLSQVIWHLEAPIARTETLQFFEIGRAAAGLVDTLVTGAAADALYAGMPNYKLLRLYQLLPPLRTALHEFHALTQTGFEPQSSLGRLLRRAYYGRALPTGPRVLGARFVPQPTPLPPPGAEFLNTYLHGDFQADTAQWVPKIERTLAAWGLEFTSPFLDTESIRVAFTVPARYKLRGWREKFILRRALRSIVDADLTDFQKFPMRMSQDAAFADALDALAGEYLSPRRVRARGLFDPRSIAALRSYSRAGRHSSEGAMRIWTAIGTEIWAEHYLDRGGELQRQSAPARPRSTVQPAAAAGDPIAGNPI